MYKLSLEKEGVKVETEIIEDNNIALLDDALKLMVLAAKEQIDRKLKK